MQSMEKILQGLKKKHRPGSGKDPFAEAVYELFGEFRDVYRRKEWVRLDTCERMYQGDHWHDVAMQDAKEPRPTTPILFSTIENMRADLADEYPEAIIRPEDSSDEVLAKVLTEVVGQSIEACDYDQEYDGLTHDLLVGGWTAQEVGWDPALNGGIGGAFLRYVSNKNILFDPFCANFQDGRAVFKFDRLPREWFRQHYPACYPHLGEDADTVGRRHGEFQNTVAPGEGEYNILIEAWFRLYDAEAQKHSIHMVKLAGGCILENSYEIKPEGYFLHGMYPFVVTPLYEQKGSSLGLGVVDMFKSAQQYSDKLDQIILKNALTAGHNRFLVMEDSVDVDDLRDFSKEVITTTAPPHSVMSWIQDRPLPPHIVGYMQQMRHSIKEESGTNDFSRGNVSAGVTAASAIAALQEMSSKRSRMEARRIHYGFKQAVRMMLEVIREFDVCPRQVMITLDGEPQALIVSREMYQQLDGGTLLPIEFAISIKAARATRFARIANNQMVLEFCGMFQGQVDPAMLMEAMDFEGQELILEKLRASQDKGMAGVQQQIQKLEGTLGSMEQALEKQQSENESLRAALRAAQRAIAAGGPLGESMAEQALPPQGMPGMGQGMPPQGMPGMEQDMPGMELPPELLAQLGMQPEPGQPPALPEAVLEKVKSKAVTQAYLGGK